MSDNDINVFYSEEDDGWIADIPDLAMCSAFGETPEEAVREVLIGKEAWLAAARELGKPIPPPRMRDLSEVKTRGVGGDHTPLDHETGSDCDKRDAARKYLGLTLPSLGHELIKGIHAAGEI